MCLVILINRKKHDADLLFLMSFSLVFSLPVRSIRFRNTLYKIYETPGPPPFPQIQ